MLKLDQCLVCAVLNKLDQCHFGFDLVFFYFLCYSVVLLECSIHHKLNLIF